MTISHQNILKLLAGVGDGGSTLYVWTPDQDGDRNSRDTCERILNFTVDLIFKVHVRTGTLSSRCISVEELMIDGTWHYAHNGDRAAVAVQMPADLLEAVLSSAAGVVAQISTCTARVA